MIIVAKLSFRTYTLHFELFISCLFSIKLVKLGSFNCILPVSKFLHFTCQFPNNGKKNRQTKYRCRFSDTPFSFKLVTLSVRRQRVCAYRELMLGCYSEYKTVFSVPHACRCYVWSLVRMDLVFSREDDIWTYWRTIAGRYLPAL